MTLNDGQAHMARPSPITLTIMRADRPLFPIVPAIVRCHQGAQRAQQDVDNGIGYVRVAQFQRFALDLAKQLKDPRKRLRPGAGLCVTTRGLTSAIGVSGAFCRRTNFWRFH